MKKDLEIVKAVTDLQLNQSIVFKEIMQTIKKIANVFGSEEESCNEALADYEDDGELYYDMLKSLLNDLTTTLEDYLEKFTKVALACAGNLSIEGIDNEIIEAAENILKLINKLKGYNEDDLEEDFYTEEYDECEEDDDEDLNSSLEYLIRQLINFEENTIILIKLYNKVKSWPKLVVPNTLFSTSEDLNNNLLIRQLINRGVEIE